MKFLLFYTFFVCSYIANASDLKIGVVDARIVESQSLVIQDIASKAEAQAKKMQNSILEKEQTLQKEVGELESKRSVLSETAFKEKQNGIQQKALKWQEDLKYENETMDIAKVECLKEVDIKAKEIVNKIAKEHKVDLIFSSQALLYHNSSVVTDLTSEFIKDLNSSIKSSNFDSHYKKNLSKKK